MRTVLFNYVSQDAMRTWEGWSEAEQQADVENHLAWFRKHREHIVGGEELDMPRTTKTLRPGRQGDGVIVTDGPYLEAKEILGGFVILETATMDEALAIASEWPSLTTWPDAIVELQPAFVRD